MKYALVIFDFDGTLADTLPWMRSLYAQFGETYGLTKLSAEDEERIRELHGRELLRALGLPIWKVPRVMREMREQMATEASQFSLFQGIADALRRLAQGGVRLAVVSSNSRENVERILGPELVALFRHFDCGASMFGKASKIRRVVRASGKKHAIYIGDEMRDGEAARDAGIAYGAVSWGYHRLELLLQLRPAEVLRKPSDIGLLSGGNGES